VVVTDPPAVPWNDDSVWNSQQPGPTGTTTSVVIDLSRSTPREPTATGITLTCNVGDDGARNINLEQSDDAERKSGSATLHSDCAAALDAGLYGNTATMKDVRVDVEGPDVGGSGATVGKEQVVVTSVKPSESGGTVASSHFSVEHCPTISPLGACPCDVSSITASNQSPDELQDPLIQYSKTSQNDKSCNICPVDQFTGVQIMPTQQRGALPDGEQVSASRLPVTVPGGQDASNQLPVESCENNKPCRLPVSSPGGPGAQDTPSRLPVASPGGQDTPNRLPVASPGGQDTPNRLPVATPGGQDTPNRPPVASPGGQDTPSRLPGASLMRNILRFQYDNILTGPTPAPPAQPGGVSLCDKDLTTVPPVCQEMVAKEVTPVDGTNPPPHGLVTRTFSSISSYSTTLVNLPGNLFSRNQLDSKGLAATSAADRIEPGSSPKSDGERDKSDHSRDSSLPSPRGFFLQPLERLKRKKKDSSSDLEVEGEAAISEGDLHDVELFHYFFSFVYLVFQLVHEIIC